MAGIRFAVKKDIEELKKIWKICFGDSDSFIQYYFQEEFRPDRVLLLECEEIASMLTMMPVGLSVPNAQKYDGVMLYAVATHPRFQGKGLSTKLMDYAKAYLKEQGVHVITLVPASPSLTHFYAKRGYHTGFYHRELSFSYSNLQEYFAPADSSCILQAASPSEYQQVRERFLSDSLYQSYDIDEIAYQKRLSVLSSCDIYLIYQQQNIIGCATMEKPDDNQLFIKELLVSEESILPAMKGISDVFHSNLYKLRLPHRLGEGLGGTIKAFGMYQILHSDMPISPEGMEGYLGIAYD